VSKLASSGLLLAADLPNFPKEWEPLLRFLNDNIGGVSRALAGQLEIPSNFRCDVVSGVTVTHATPIVVHCPRLGSANVCIVLASTPQIAYSYAACTRDPNGARVTCWLQSGSGTSKVTLLLLDVPGADANAAPSAFTTGLPSGGSSGNVLTLAGSPLAPTWAAPAGGAWSLANKPATPDARDEEFEGASAAADGWTRSGSLIAGAPDPLVQFATAGSHKESYNSLRPSWELMQAATDSSVSGLWKAKTFDNNYAGFGSEFIWARMYSFNRDGLGFPNANTQFATHLVIGDAAGTLYAGLSFNWSTGSPVQAFQCLVTGVAVNTVQAETANMLFGAEYLGILRKHNGTAGACTYHFYAAPSNGAWVRLVSLTDGTGSEVAAGSVGFKVRHSGAIAISPTISGCDFIRFRADGSLP
jgi:hypothetical protein